MSNNLTPEQNTMQPIYEALINSLKSKWIDNDKKEEGTTESGVKWQAVSINVIDSVMDTLLSQSERISESENGEPFFHDIAVDGEGGLTGIELLQSRLARAEDELKQLRQPTKDVKHLMEYVQELMAVEFIMLDSGKQYLERTEVQGIFAMAFTGLSTDLARAEKLADYVNHDVNCNKSIIRGDSGQVCNCGLQQALSELEEK